MFFDPIIDRENSIQMIVHLLKIDGELVPAFELVAPEEEDLTREMLYAMQDAVIYSSQKIQKVLDQI